MMCCMGFPGSFLTREGQTILLFVFLLPTIWNADMEAKFPKDISDYEAMHRRKATK